ncbi:MAG TPA: UvrD-helicase domain-containing protein, partial [Albitalea sp.]|nr:UvrD-helicase domain-containing protein [Albitalea sp.]
ALRQRQGARRMDDNAPLRLTDSPTLRVRRARKSMDDGLKAVEELMSVSRNVDNIDRLRRVMASMNAMLRETTAMGDDLTVVVAALPDVVVFANGDAQDPIEAREDAREEDAPRPMPKEALSLFGDESGLGGETSPSSTTLRSDTGTRRRGARRETDEQIAVIACSSRDLAVNAFAGTGKTTTLEGYAAARPRERLLYVAFNKSVAEEGTKRFPKNVTSRTSHSLAYAQCGKAYTHKLGTPRARDVMEFLDQSMRIPTDTSNDRYMFAQEALTRVKDFFAEGSRHEDISEEGTAQWYLMPSGRKIPGAEVLRGARLLWRAMKDPENRLIQMPHDGYLKLFALQGPDLSRYDTILLDEAQDTNPCVLSMIKAQRTGKVLVGDRRQNIYGFRGSIDAMSKLPGATMLALTHSFRFGPEIAGVANNILGTFCSERLLLTGAGTATLEDDPSRAHLFRTNAGLFGAAVAWLSQGNGAIHFVGGVENYNLDVITDTWWLKNGTPGLVQDAFIRKFASFEQLEQYADTVQDKELMARMRIVAEFDRLTPDLVAKVKAAHVPANRASLNMTTAHKAKGMEWGEVTLGEDFPELMAVGMPRSKNFFSGKDQHDEILPQEEAHLLYVACTRAKSVLNPNEELAAFLAWCRENAHLKRPAAQKTPGGRSSQAPMADSTG